MEHAPILGQQTLENADEPKQALAPVPGNQTLESTNKVQQDTQTYSLSPEKCD
jgi:hypothetical protein